jgi:hypothetical protein
MNSDVAALIGQFTTDIDTRLTLQSKPNRLQHDGRYDYLEHMLDKRRIYDSHNEKYVCLIFTPIIYTIRINKDTGEILEIIGCFKNRWHITTHSDGTVKGIHYQIDDQSYIQVSDTYTRIQGRWVPENL